MSGELPANQPTALRRIGNLVIRLLTIIADEYVIVLMLFLIIRFIVGERWDVVAIGNSFLHLLLIPAFACLLLCLLRRRYRMMAVSAVPVLVFMLGYGVTFLPRATAAAADTSSQIKLLTYNMHSSEPEDELRPMLALIRQSDADVVALQELSAEGAALFEKEWATAYPYQAFHTTPGVPVIGQGVLSRYPIHADEYWRNEQFDQKLAHQRVEIEVNGRVIALYNTHPIHPFGKTGRLYAGDIRAAEIDSVLKRATVDKSPVIIAGDFNMSDMTEDYARITASFGDTYREVGWGLGFTFPDFSTPYAVPVSRALPIPPLVRLDYVFHSHDISPLEARVWPTSGGSDHRPVFVRLALPTS